MAEFRSKSCRDGRMEKEGYYSENHRLPSSGLQDLRCYSTSYASSQSQEHREIKFKKGKNSGGGPSSSSSSSRSWSLNDPELQRKKRVASYKVYDVEGKMKGSFRKSFRWFKHRYTQIVYGW